MDRNGWLAWLVRAVPRPFFQTNAQICLSNYYVCQMCDHHPWVKSRYRNMTLIGPDIGLAEVRKGTQHLCLTQRLGSQHRSPGTALQKVASKSSLNKNWGFSRKSSVCLRHKAWGIREKYRFDPFGMFAQALELPSLMASPKRGHSRIPQVLHA